MSPAAHRAIPPETHELAGEYVLGTLSAAARREVEARLDNDAVLRAAVLAWEERLLPLAGLADPLSPSPRLWQRIERSLNARPQATTPRATTWWRGWDTLALWRSLAAGGLATAALLAVVLAGRLAEAPPATRFMVVLVAPDDRAPGWVVQASSPQRVELIPLATIEVPADKTLQFWTKADDWKAPVSLGLVTPGRSLSVPLDTLPALQPNQLFELTLEPRGGSPIGKPTGPVRFIGRAVKVM